MLKWTASRRSGRKVIGLGLTAENVDLLMQGKPIMIDGAKMGLPFDIAVHYGATVQTLIDDLDEQGITVGPETKVRKE